MGKITNYEFNCDHCKTILPRSELWPASPPVENRVQLHIRIPLPDNPAEHIEAKATELCATCRKNLKICLEMYLASVGKPLTCVLSGGEEKDGKIVHFRRVIE